MSCSGFFDTASWTATENVLPPTAPMPMDQCPDDPGRQLLAGNVIGVPDLRRDRRRVVFEVGVRVVAAIHHHAAQRQMNEVRAFEILPRPVVAERCHPRSHQQRKPLAERHTIEPQCRVQRAAARIEQHVGAAEQAEQILARLSLAQIEHDGFFVAVVVPEEQRALRAGTIVEKRADPAGGVAFRRFDLDHLGAEAGEQQPRHIPRVHRRFRPPAARPASRDQRCPSSRPAHARQDPPPSSRFPLSVLLPWRPVEQRGCPSLSSEGLWRTQRSCQLGGLSYLMSAGRLRNASQNLSIGSRETEHAAAIPYAMLYSCLAWAAPGRRRAACVT